MTLGVPAHGVDLATQVKKGGKGTIKIVRRNSDGKDESVNKTTYGEQDLFIVGDEFEDGVEVVLNFDQLGADSMNTRISAQPVDGKFRALMPFFGTAGTWRITAYVPAEDVGGKATDHKRVLEMVDQATLVVGKVKQ